MNKNIIVVGAMAVGLYLLSQANKAKKVIVKKKAPRRQVRKYLKPHPYLKKPKVKKIISKKKAIYNKPKVKRVIARKKAIYNKPKVKRVIARKKAIYHKPKIKKAATRKKPTYYSPKSRIAIPRKQQIKRMQRRKR